MKNLKETNDAKALHLVCGSEQIELIIRNCTRSDYRSKYLMQIVVLNAQRQSRDPHQSLLVDGWE